MSAILDLALANRCASDANSGLLLANARERSRFDLALEAIKTFHGTVSDDSLLNETQFAGLRDKLLKGATQFYGRLEAMLKDQPDSRSRSALGKAYQDIGELTARIGSQSEAIRALERGLELRLTLAAELDAPPDTKLEATQSLIAVGNLRQATGDPAAALASFERAQHLLQPLIRSSPSHAPYLAAVAQCLQGIAQRPVRNRPHAGIARLSRTRADHPPETGRRQSEHNSISARPRGELPRHRRNPQSQRPGGRSAGIVRARSGH